MTTAHVVRNNHVSASHARRGRVVPKSEPAVRYTPEQRAEAVRSCTERGTAATHRALGIPKQTLSRWCKAAGVDVGAAATSRVENATAATRARAAELTASTVELLEAHIAQAGDYLATVAGVNALAARLIAQADPDTITMTAGLAGPCVELSADSQAAELYKVALALDSLPLAIRDAELILTRAIHDLRLLRGEATERGEIVVEFAVPRPSPNGDADAQVIDPAAAGGDRLHDMPTSAATVAGKGAILA